MSKEAQKKQNDFCKNQKWKVTTMITLIISIQFQKKIYANIANHANKTIL